MTVSDLLDIYDSINRDITKLKCTKTSIPIDREYSSVLQNTLSTEIEKFENLKSLLLNLEIDMPEDTSTVSEISTVEIETIPEDIDYSDPTFFPTSV